MRLGGITWWRNNYGSVLQALALQEFIHNYEEIDYEIVNQFGKSITSPDNFLNKLKTIGVVKTFQRVFWKIGITGLRKRSKKVQFFVDSNLNVSGKIYTEEMFDKINSDYDAFLCGSDQIWNPNLVALDSIYWLGFANINKPCIAYAPSIGVNQVDSNSAKCIERNLLNFDAISCREHSGTALINKIFGTTKCVTTLDPTLLIGNGFWDKYTKNRLIDGDYIFVYLLRGNRHQRKIIEKFASLADIKIVTIPFLETEHPVWYDFKFGDIKYWDAAPDEFINLIRYARYVFTDSFHGTVFSIIYHTPFFIFPKVGKAQMNRILDLLVTTGINDRIIDDLNDIFKMVSSPIDWETADKNLSNERIKSKHFLDEAIKCAIRKVT